MKKYALVSFLDILEIIVKWRKFIIRNVLIITIVAAIISLLLPLKYTATATILPPSPEQNAMLGMLSYSIPGGLSSLSSMGGVLSGLATPSDLFAAIMKSGRIRGTIIKRFNLQERFKAKTSTDAAEILNGITRIIVSPEGIIAVSVTHTDKNLATDIANAYIEELDDFNTATAMTVGKKYRIFIEQRLKETIDTLAKAEDAFRDFQTKHRTIALDAEIKSAIETIVKLKSQIILLEVKKGALVSSSQMGNPYLYNIDRELKELKKQLSKIEFGSKVQEEKNFGAGFSVPFSKLPEVSLEYARLLRNVKVQEAIYELLTQQYEQAKIMELKDTPTIQSLDRASPPEQRTFPKRTQIVVLVFLASFIANSGLALLLANIKKAKNNKDIVYTRWYAMWRQIKSDIIQLKRLFKKSP